MSPSSIAYAEVAQCLIEVTLKSEPKFKETLKLELLSYIDSSDMVNLHTS